MSLSAERMMVHDEIDRLPEEQLQDAMRILQDLRRGANSGAKNRNELMRFAGSWADLPADVFESFTAEVMERRQRAFTRRRERENGAS